ncbi:hypothetical protein [Pelagibacterium luteolum]|uniref:Uncharacterized protein n=1 Tax=Pelagibacterium luteolum TaxID=440168 RepID=A0A1G7TP53_9HYPH|nr:hypothetical protein [Pelagibacterium luteolum]SDG37117.1 hypothetical protein SAMN04487974_102256 [Pelagibacterium luteolum]
MTETGEPDWAMVRADYEAGEISVRAIAEKHSVTLDRINHRKIKEIWRPRRLWTSRGQRRVIINKLMHLLERQIALLEAKLDTNEAFDMADTKLIETITKTYEKLTELQDVHNKAETRKTARLDPELEAVREKLIRRVKALETE